MIVTKPRTLALAVLSLAATTPQPQLLVTEPNASHQCREAIAHGEQKEPIREALATDVAEDLRRYLRGFSVQVTPILDAAWHGGVHFCTKQAEVVVARALSQLVVKPVEGASTGDSLLPAGAESLLTALASDVLAAELAATPVSNSAEAMRKTRALAIVHTKTTATAVEEDIVVALDTELTDRVGVHFARHAAVYFLLRSDPAFAVRLGCARESLAHGSHVKFSYDVSGQVITGFECVHSNPSVSGAADQATVERAVLVTLRQDRAGRGGTRLLRLTYEPWVRGG